MILIPAFVLAFFLTAILMPFVRKAAVTSGFVDMPSGRKQHDDIIPPSGGLVIVPVFIFTTLVMSPALAAHWPFFVALLLIWATGVYDDGAAIPANLKFLIQFVAALLIVLVEHAEIWYLGNLFSLGEIGLGFFAVPFTVLCIMLLINAVNMIDGLDGLCGGVLLIMMVWLLVATMLGGGHELALPICAGAGTLLGFLVYNARYPGHNRASVFMGDSGSTAMGLIIAWLVIHLSQVYNSFTYDVIDPVIIAWILALPAFDALSLFAYRSSRKRHPFSPDRRHLHYLIKDSGWSVEKTVLFIHLTTFVYGAYGVIGYYLGLPHIVLFGPWLALFGLHGMLIFGRLSIGQVVDVDK